MAIKFRRTGSKVWYIKYKNEAGEWKNISTGTESATDAETIRKNYDAKELNHRHKMPVRKIRADIFAELELFRDNEIPKSTTGRPKSKKGVATYQALINTFSAWMKGQGYSEYEHITEDAANGFLDYLVGLKRSASNITKHRQTLSNFWKWSEKKNYCHTNPWIETKNPKKEKKIPRFFSNDELNRIFSHSKPPYTNVFKFLFLTGLRIGELGNLEWCDYLEQQKLINIRVMEGNKTKREEVVPLNADAVAIIEDQRKRISSPDSHRYIFVNDHGRKMDNANIYRALKVVMKHAKITNASPHTFRHSCASHLVIKGVSLYIVKDILRHASIRETEIYAHLSKEATRTAIDLLTVHNTTVPPQKS